MKNQDIEKRLDNVLRQLDIDIATYSTAVSCFRKKLDLLNSTGRYNKLLKSLFRAIDRSEFGGYVFEALLAYDFESKGHKLEYEVKANCTVNTSVDFCYNLDAQERIHFELKLANRKDELRADADEVIRLQHLILRACQDSKGRPIKFPSPEEGRYSFIVIHVSGLLDTMIRKIDCWLAMYGDVAVERPDRRGIFGLCQELSPNASESERNFYNKFKHFRSTIHGVLFVQNEGNPHGPPYIDAELQYFLIGNCHLLNRQEGKSIIENLESFLKQWGV